MRAQYYHFYTIPKSKSERSRRRNIDAVRSAAEARIVRDYWNGLGYETAVYITQQPTAPDNLPFGERLWK
jgi:hypothetical protein